MSARSGLVGKNHPGPIWGHFRQICPWPQKCKNNVICCLFSLVWGVMCIWWWEGKTWGVHIRCSYVRSILVPVFECGSMLVPAFELLFHCITILVPCHWPTKENWQTNHYVFLHFPGPWKNVPEMAPKWGREDCVPTNLDLANILGRTDLDFGSFHFFGFPNLAGRAGLRDSDRFRGLIFTATTLLCCGHNVCSSCEAWLGTSIR